MNQEKKKVTLLVLLLCLFAISLVVLKNKQANDAQIMGVKSTKPVKEKTTGGKSSKAKNVVVEEKLKGYEKATSKNEKSPSINSALFKKNIVEVIEELDEVAVSESAEGSVEVAEELQEIVETEEEVVEDIAEIIEEIEEESTLKTFLVGADYKNLGSLRSSLVHNRNQIRKLTKTTAKVQSEENNLVVQEQLIVLTQERERIKDVIEENESQFSILGWIRKFLSGYVSEPLDTEAEEELLEEVVDVLDDEIIEEIEEEAEEEAEEATGAAEVTGADL